MVFRSHPIGACCMFSGRLQGFIPQKLAHFEEHILTMHTGCSPVNWDYQVTRNRLFRTSGSVVNEPGSCFLNTLCE
jgi:hypothetical protein